MELRYCRECNSQRKLAVCQKCGTETVEPHPEWEWPALPDVERIRALAREVGYAIGEHGTKERDLDLIAAPWSELALQYTYLDVMEHIAKGMNARVLAVEEKPLGRRACTIQINGWFKAIDLSVCPIAHP